MDERNRSICTCTCSSSNCVWPQQGSCRALLCRTVRSDRTSVAWHAPVSSTPASGGTCNSSGAISNIVTQVHVCLYEWGSHMSGRAVDWLSHALAPLKALDQHPLDSVRVRRSSQREDLPQQHAVRPTGTTTTPNHAPQPRLLRCSLHVGLRGVALLAQHLRRHPLDGHGVARLLAVVAVFGACRARSTKSPRSSVSCPAHPPTRCALPGPGAQPEVKSY